MEDHDDAALKERDGYQTNPYWTTTVGFLMVTLT
jgi:hypothetical protein